VPEYHSSDFSSSRLHYFSLSYIRSRRVLFLSLELLFLRLSNHITQISEIGMSSLPIPHVPYVLVHLNALAFRA
jgi:hypothetical protein